MDALTTRLTVDALLAEARTGLERLTPEEALAATASGAVLVDVRSEDERRRQGVLLPGAVHHPLSVVAWRLDPAVPTRNTKLSLDEHLVLFCREGYCSSLAAAWLQAIGFTRATDLIGGVDEWVAAGLPVEPYRCSAGALDEREPQALAPARPAHPLDGS